MGLPPRKKCRAEARRYMKTLEGCAVFVLGNFLAGRDITVSEVAVLTPCKTRFLFSFYTRMRSLGRP
jgi:hypothetical protein